jgi:hypothetical protein
VRYGYGVHPYFCLCSEVTYKDKVSYRLAAVAGGVLVRDHLGSLVKVAYVDFERDGSQGNPHCRLSPTSWLSQVSSYTSHYRISSYVEFESFPLSRTFYK